MAYRLVSKLCASAEESPGTAIFKCSPTEGKDNHVPEKQGRNLAGLGVSDSEALVSPSVGGGGKEVVKLF